MTEGSVSIGPFRHIVYVARCNQVGYRPHVHGLKRPVSKASIRRLERLAEAAGWDLREARRGGQALWWLPCCGKPQQREIS